MIQPGLLQSHKYQPGWWLNQSLWKILYSQIVDHFPQVGVENEKSLKPPPIYIMIQPGLVQINPMNINQLSQLPSTNQWTSWVNKQSEWIDRHIGISAFHPQQRQEFPTIRVPPGVPNDASTTQPQLVGGWTNPCWKIFAKMGIFPKLGSNFGWTWKYLSCHQLDNY